MTRKAIAAAPPGDDERGTALVEFALVLCSVAVLTKRKEFWYAGIGFGLLGVVVALTGLAGVGLHAVGH